MSPRCRVCRATLFESGITMCVSCTSRRKVKMIAGGIAAGVTVAIGVVLVVASARRSDAMEMDTSGQTISGVAAGMGDGDRTFDGSKQSAGARGARSDKQEETEDAKATRSCTTATVLRSMQTHNGARMYAHAIELADAFERFCGRQPTFDLERFQAHEALEQWDQADVVATALLRDKPRDSMYWAFRGRVRNGQKRYAGALAALRQSFAEPDRRNTGLLVDYIALAAKESGDPCEGAHALRWLSTRRAVGARNHVALMSQLFREHNCIARDGSGSLSWLDSERATTGTLAGVTARIAIDPALGTTLVTAAFAATAKLAPGGKVEILTPDGIATGASALADIAVGESSALGVPVAIVDTLPDKTDVVLGTSYLWRFDVHPGSTGETIAESFLARFRRR